MGQVRITTGGPYAHLAGKLGVRLAGAFQRVGFDRIGARRGRPRLADLGRGRVPVSLKVGGYRARNVVCAPNTRDSAPESSLDVPSQTQALSASGDWYRVAKDGIALIKNAPNSDNGKAFIDWALSKEAQTFLVKEMGRRSIRTDVPSSDVLPSFSEIKVVSYDISWAEENRGEFVQKWTDLLVSR